MPVISGRVIWIAAAAAISLLVSAWWYARVEETVRGRLPAACLRAVALFLLLAGPRLPSLENIDSGSGNLVILVDGSSSMGLPTRPGGGSRRDSAVREAEGLPAARVLAFGEVTGELRGDELAGTGGHSRLGPALQAARLAGADSVVILTDGEIDDREEARRTAERLGLGVREIQVAAPVRRFGIRGVSAPQRARAGDTIRITAELVAGGGPAPGRDVEVTLSGPSGPITTTRAPAPTPGRSALVTLLLSPLAPAVGTAEWRPYDIALTGDADPYGVADARRLWVRVTAGIRGALVVSEDPDWETRYLIPVLRRSVAGGARGYLRVAADKYVGTGPDPVAYPAPATVRREARSADVLVVQGAPGDLPEWLRATAERHPRVLHLVRGPGEVPGTDLEVGESLPGEWYPTGPPPASPVSGFLIGIDLDALPPVLRQHGLSGTTEWTALTTRRGRRGGARPLVVASSGGRSRRVIVVGEGTWRWAARPGPARRLYRGLLGGLAGWLSERASSQAVTLADDGPVARRNVRWRVDPGVRDLSLTVTDSAGSVIWERTVAAPDTILAGPSLAAGDARFTANGRLGDGGFRVERPFTVTAGGAELLPRASAAPLELSVPSGKAKGSWPAGRFPVWPFAVAAALLCLEWAWRRRIGLR